MASITDWEGWNIPSSCITHDHDNKGGVVGVLVDGMWLLYDESHTDDDDDDDRMIARHVLLPNIPCV